MLWTSVPEVGKTNLKQTTEFKLAVETCLTNGYTQVAIALAIHDSSIARGHYPGDNKGKGLNYDKIKGAVCSCKKPSDNQKINK